MSIALDVGTSRLRSVRRDGSERIGRSAAAAFALLRDDPATRELLIRAGVAFATGEGDLVLIGDAAEAHATAFQTTPLRLLPDGVLPGDDPPARQVLATLVDGLLPEAPQYSLNQAAAPCGLVLPAGALADEHVREFLIRLVRLRGYHPLPVSAGHALAIATLADDGFTGLALAFGAGGCVLSLVQHGCELAVAAESRGTDWIDAHLAATGKRYAFDARGQRYLDTESVREEREDAHAALTRPLGSFDEHIAALYTDLLATVAAQMTDTLAACRPGLFRMPLPIVCGGGGTRPAGFTNLVQHALTEAGLPLPLGPIRLAPADDYLTAHGALIFSELETAVRAAA